MPQETGVEDTWYCVGIYDHSVYYLGPKIGDRELRARPSPRPPAEESINGMYVRARIKFQKFKIQLPTMSEPVNPDDATDLTTPMTDGRIGRPAGIPAHSFANMKNSLLWRWWRGSPKGQTLQTHDEKRGCGCGGDEIFDLQRSSMCSAGELVDDSSSHVLLPFVSYASSLRGMAPILLLLPLVAAMQSIWDRLGEDGELRLEQRVLRRGEENAEFLLRIPSESSRVDPGV